MQHKPTTLWIALTLAVLIPTVAFAGPGFGPRGERGDGPGRHFFPPPGYLDLTDEQIEAARIIRDDLREQVQTLHEGHAALRQELRDLLDGDAPDPTAVGELVIQLHDERGQVREAIMAAEEEFSALLTPEQLVKWKNFKELRARRGHRGGGDGPGPRDDFGGPPFGE